MLHFHGENGCPSRPKTIISPKIKPIQGTTNPGTKVPRYHIHTFFWNPHMPDNSSVVKWLPEGSAVQYYQTVGFAMTNKFWQRCPLRRGFWRLMMLFQGIAICSSRVLAEISLQFCPSQTPPLCLYGQDDDKFPPKGQGLLLKEGPPTHAILSQNLVVRKLRAFRKASTELWMKAIPLS